MERRRDVCNLVDGSMFPAGVYEKKHLLESINALKSKHFESLIKWLGWQEGINQHVEQRLQQNKPVVAYKLNLHVFLFIQSKALFMRVKQKASRFAMSKEEKLKFLKFLPARHTAMYSINLSSISTFQD